MDPASAHWTGECRDDGRLVARVGRVGPVLVAQFPTLGVLTVDRARDVVEFRVAPRADVAAVDKLTDGLIPALVRHARGKLTLHAGGVELSGHAIGVLGPSRAGKSTLVSALCMRAGGKLLSDDTLPLEFAGPSCSVSAGSTRKVTWLFPDARFALGLEGSGPAKMPATVPVSCANLLPLTTLFWLTFAEREVAIRRLHGHEALKRLAQSAIRLIVDEPTAQLQEFEQLRVLSRSCRIYELSRPADLGQLDSCVAQITARVREKDV